MIFEDCDAFRRTERFQFFLIACKAIRKARDDSEANTEYRNKTLLDALNICQDIDSTVLTEAGYQNEEFGIQLRLLRLEKLEGFLKYES